MCAIFLLAACVMRSEFKWMYAVCVGVVDSSSWVPGVINLCALRGDVGDSVGCVGAVGVINRVRHAVSAVCQCNWLEYRNVNSKIIFMAWRSVHICSVRQLLSVLRTIRIWIMTKVW